MVSNPAPYPSLSPSGGKGQILPEGGDVRRTEGGLTELFSGLSISLSKKTLVAYLCHDVLVLLNILFPRVLHYRVKLQIRIHSFFGNCV